jgi:hypothetical protein
MSNSEHSARQKKRTHRVHPDQATTGVFGDLRQTGSVQFGLQRVGGTSADGGKSDTHDQKFLPETGR